MPAVSAAPVNTQCLDFLFSRSVGTLDPVPPPAAVPAAPRAPVDDFPQAPPEGIDGSLDVKAAYEWFQKEKARLQEYTRVQIEEVFRQKEKLLAKHTRSEEVLAMRSQEVNREMQFLAAQAETLRQRAAELTEWESALGEQMTKLTQAQEELLSIQTTSENVRRDTQDQQAHLERLRAEAAALQSAQTVARDRFQAVDVELRERQQAWEAKNADLAARLAEMEQRYQTMERTEEALRRRNAELDELEERTCAEIEAQERQISEQRREIDALRARLRTGLVQALEAEEQARYEIETYKLQVAEQRKTIDALRARIEAGSDTVHDVPNPLASSRPASTPQLAKARS